MLLRQNIGNDITQTLSIPIDDEVEQTDAPLDLFANIDRPIPDSADSHKMLKIPRSKPNQFIYKWPEYVHNGLLPFGHKFEEDTLYIDTWEQGPSAIYKKMDVSSLEDC